MKRRTSIIIIAVLIAISMLGITAFANVPSYEGYEALKALMQEEQGADMTAGSLTGSVTIKEDGKTLVVFQGTLTGDKNQQSGSGTVNIQSESMSRQIDLYMNQEEVYLFDETNEEYYKFSQNKEMYTESYEEQEFQRRNVFSKGQDEMTPAQEELLDFIMGELKDDFVVAYISDESKTISFELTESEMPMLLNLMISAGNSSTDKTSFNENEFDDSDLVQYPLFAEIAALDEKVPNIVDEFQLNNIKFSITVDDNNNLKAIEMSANISGNDKAGTKHTLQIDSQFDVSKLEEVTVVQPDLSNKKVIEIDPEVFDRSTGYEGTRYQRHF